MSKNRPIVLSFSGHDPSGGAGIQADIETISSHQCHSCSVITCLTEQDSNNVKQVIPQKPQDIVNQANTILKDFPVKVIKIGLIGHHKIAKALQSILLLHPHIPVVLDPVLAAGGGTSLANKQLISSINELLLPVTTILTPNSIEARSLSEQHDLNECGVTLLNRGADYVLITGTHEQSTVVKNKLFQTNEKPETFRWDRLEHSYHGSGCTLASSIAALIAQGLDPFTAVAEAQEFTWNSLSAAYKPGQGQMNPQRFFWMEEH